MAARSIDTLAVFGNAPAFAEPLHVGRPNIGNRQRLRERIEDLLDRRYLTNIGPYAKEFEQRVREIAGVRECVATCNGTIALEILIRAAGLTGEVIVPSFTFAATAHALQWQEIKPVFCDIDPRTHTLDPDRIEELITPKTTGIMGVHLWGRACEVERLQRIADKHGLKLLFDASHAFGCSHRRRMIGGHGVGEVFSFHATKFLNSFEGGAIVTDDSELAEKMRLMRNFGFESRDRVIYLGSNGKMTEVCAAMGVTSIESMDEFVDANRRNYRHYRERLGRLGGLTVMPYAEDESSNYNYVVVDVDEQAFGLSRDQLLHVLEAENILARRYFYPGVHRMEPYRSLQPQAALVLPETERLCERILTLPTGQTVEAGDVDRIADVIETACVNAPALRAQLDGLVLTS
ncbi:MAG: dTDP-4-amino-4,6-dideoxygalactose transaminase [Chlamydiales bacterium]|jgi:dTDP-4-amino-4,6-dideoxygalactose transaminase